MIRCRESRFVDTVFFLLGIVINSSLLKCSKISHSKSRLLMLYHISCIDSINKEKTEVHNNLHDFKKSLFQDSFMSALTLRVLPSASLCKVSADILTLDLQSIGSKHENDRAEYANCRRMTDHRLKLKYLLFRPPSSLSSAFSDWSSTPSSEDPSYAICVVQDSMPSHIRSLASTQRGFNIIRSA